MSSPPFANPDQVLIHRFFAQGEQPLAFDANPMAVALGTQLLHVDRSAKRVELAFAPQALFVQGTGVIQGGAVTAMLDFAMAFACLAALPGEASCATVNLNTSFLRAAPQGTYLASGVVERLARQLAFARAELRRADDGVVVANATSTLTLLWPRGSATAADLTL